MSLVDNLAKARQRWPTRATNLPSPVKAVFDAWEQCEETQLDDALEQIEGFTRPPGRFSVKQKCRDLTLLLSPLPSTMSAVPPLTNADVSVFSATWSPHMTGRRGRTPIQFAPRRRKTE